MTQKLRTNQLVGFVVSIIVLLLIVSYALQQRNTVLVEEQFDTRNVQVHQYNRARQDRLTDALAKMAHAGEDIDRVHSFPLCGQICNFSMHKRKEDPFLRKDFNCKDMFLRLKNPPGKVFKPPLKKPPPELLLDFTQNGGMNLSSMYFDGSRQGPKVTFTPKQIKTLLTNDKDKNIGSYGAESNGFKQVLYRYKDQLKEKTGIVIGSQSPWLEVMLLNLGVKHVTTVDYNAVFFDHPQLSFEFMSDLADKITKNQSLLMDFAASFSSLEHSGLGRYGDPINPHGDLEAAAQIWCMLKPGALFYLGIPVNFGTSEGSLVFNAHRIYGEARIEQITANYEILERKPVGMHGVLVLKKTL